MTNDSIYCSKYNLCTIRWNNFYDHTAWLQERNGWAYVPFLYEWLKFDVSFQYCDNLNDSDTSSCVYHFSFVCCTAYFYPDESFFRPRSGVVYNVPVDRLFRAFPVLDSEKEYILSEIPDFIFPDDHYCYSNSNGYFEHLFSFKNYIILKGYVVFDKRELYYQAVLPGTDSKFIYAYDRNCCVKSGRNFKFNDGYGEVCSPSDFKFWSIDESSEFHDGFYDFNLYPNSSNLNDGYAVLGVSYQRILYKYRFKIPSGFSIEWKFNEWGSVFYGLLDGFSSFEGDRFVSCTTNLNVICLNIPEAKDHLHDYELFFMGEYSRFLEYLLSFPSGTVSLSKIDSNVFLPIVSYPYFCKQLNNPYKNEV